MSRAGVVILGAGQAGFQTAVSLRAEGYAGSVVLVGDEPGLPYNRPPLSKAYLLGKEPEDDLPFRPASFYAEQGIELRTGVRAVSIDRQPRRVRLDNGDALAYEWLVLATGARVRRLAFLPGALYLRTLEDARACKAQFAAGGGSLLVVGAGFIGLEVAAAARALGLAVTVVAAEDRPMSRVVSPAISRYFAELHRANGVDLRLGQAVTPADTATASSVLVGIGVVPNTELAADAGLAVAGPDGIRVDELLRTSDDRIFAIGDCAHHPNRFLPGGSGRFESIQNAVDQARSVAATIAGKPPRAYHNVPWFWSHQYEAKLQIAGNPALATHFVTRGDGDSFSVFGFRDSTLFSVESVNRPADHIQSRKLLDTGAPLTPEQAADPSYSLKIPSK